MQEESFQIKRKILSYNYWETVKFEKDLAFVLGADHPKRLQLRDSANEINEEIHRIDRKIKEKTL